MLQFGTHFCMQKFLEFAVSQVFRQISSQDFFCAMAGPDTISKASAPATDKTLSILLPPIGQW
jgi:hypothetical protein